MAMFTLEELPLVVMVTLPAVEISELIATDELPPLVVMLTIPAPLMVIGVTSVNDVLLVTVTFPDVSTTVPRVTVPRA